MVVFNRNDHVAAHEKLTKPPRNRGIVVEYSDSDIPILYDICDEDTLSPLSLDELEKVAVPINEALLHTCTRKKTDRRQDNQVSFEGQERRNGRDRRLFSYY